METAAAKFPILDAVAARRSRSLSEIAAGAALVLVWAALWVWLVLGVAGPLSTSMQRPIPPTGPLVAGLTPPGGGDR